MIFSGKHHFLAEMKISEIWLKIDKINAFYHRSTGHLTRRLFLVKNKYFDNLYFSLKIFNFLTVSVSFGGKHHFVPKNDDFRNFAKNRDKQCLSFSLTTVQSPGGQNTYFWQNNDFSRIKKMLKYCHFVG